MRFVLCLIAAGLLPAQDVYVAGFTAKKLYHRAANGELQAVALPGNPLDIVLTSDNALAYVSEPTRDAVAVIRTSDDGLVATIPVPSSPRGLAIGNAGTRLYVANDSESAPHVSIIDTCRNARVATLDLTPQRAHSSMAVAAFGALLAVGTRTGHVLLYDTAVLPPALLASREVGARVTHLVFSPWGTKLYVLLANPSTPPVNCTSGSAGNLHVLDVPALSLKTAVAAGTAELTAGAIVNGSRLYVADRRGVLHAIDLGSDRLISNLPVGTQLTGLASLHDTLLVADAARNVVYTLRIGRRGQPDRIESSLALEHAVPLALAATPPRLFATTTAPVP